MEPDPATHRICLVTAVYNPPADAFEDTVAAVLAQEHENWQWVMVDDCSPDPAVWPRLLQLAADEPRVTVHRREANGGIVAASNDAFARAETEFVALMDHDDVLTPQALRTMAETIVAHPDLDYAYSDQALMARDGSIITTYRKPEWSPERLRHHMYTSHLALFRTSVVEEVGGFRPGLDGSQDHDLALRVSERARTIVHVPEVLYQWRAVEGSAADDAHAKPYAWDAGVRAVQDHLDRVGIPAVASKGRLPGLYHVEREPDLLTPVSIIIPTIGSSALVWGKRRHMVVETVRSVIALSDHGDLEFVIVYDPPTPPEVLRELSELEGAAIRLVPFHEPFNFSAKCNVGAVAASGEVLVFLNDDMEAASGGLVEQLIAPLREPGVGATGAKLLFANTHVQHGGVVFGSGTLTHRYYGARHPHDHGDHGELWMNREASGLTGACLAMRRETYWEVGGFTEALPANYNDVDLSLKVRRAGLRLLWLHGVVLYHFESMTRPTGVHPWETELLADRWGHFKNVRERYCNNL